MAVASSRQPFQQLTPPSSAHGGANNGGGAGGVGNGGGRGSWDFAVPLDSTAKSSYPDHDLHMHDDLSSTHTYPSQPNGLAITSSSRAMDPQAQYYDEHSAYSSYNQTNGYHNQARAGSGDRDDALEYNEPSEMVTDSRVEPAPKSKGKKKPTKKQTPQNWTEAEKNENNWIHRDKLKEIETRELEAAGFRVGRSSRSNSRSQSANARHMSRDRTNSEATDPLSNGDHHADSRRMISPIPAEGEEEEVHQTTGWDIRSPEEIAADREQYAAKNTHMIRPSTSRIPIAKTSPLPRPRNGSGNWDPDAIATNGARVRTGSISSQILLDDPKPVEAPQKSPMKTKFDGKDAPVLTPTPSTSKSKSPSKPTPNSGVRKVTPKGQTKPRNTSGNSPVKRPGTSGGSLSRPGTSHRPEGEAPWVATMYKPDPMLPPDQQIIPTHAKRMQQEQWATEGRTASVYDKEFRALNTDDFNKSKRNSPVSPLEPEVAPADAQWPLSSPDKLAPANVADNTPKSPVSETGSYKLTPTIPQSPRIPSPERRVAPVIDPLPVNTTRLPEPPPETEKEKEKKGCCCISDGEDNHSVAAAEEVEVSADASAGKGQMSVLEALKGVLKLALIHDGLARGLREASKALDRRQAHMCVLNEACEEEAYKKLVVALCSEHKIPLIKVPDGKQLGEWAGLCQLDREGNARKIVNCSCVVVKDWGEESQERSILLNYFQTEQ
ncbi:hypothetical protein DM02DRAFT_642794 [Periconia macrospinosa]|uniref:40S ribosomal protein S12 n=1 Tax=Periconia macrospinosa TaxID=97972 RepID=A0A2V1DQY4_9PLEO|nr:hypothetical protein DM02DRAFT_642794 [Periconia macrospinosa]